MNPAAHRRLRSFPRSLMLGSCVLAVSLLGPRTAGAETESRLAALPAQAIDLVVLRPLGAARLAAGAALWVPVSLVQALMDMSKAAAAPLGLSEGANARAAQDTLDIFVLEPARYVFRRPLGENLEGG